MFFSFFFLHKIQQETSVLTQLNNNDNSLSNKTMDFCCIETIAASGVIFLFPPQIKSVHYIINIVLIHMSVEQCLLKFLLENW